MVVQFLGHVHDHPDGPDIRGLGISLLLRPHPGGNLLSGGRRRTPGALDLHVEKHQGSLPGFKKMKSFI